MISMPRSSEKYFHFRVTKVVFRKSCWQVVSLYLLPPLQFIFELVLLP